MGKNIFEVIEQISGLGKPTTDEILKQVKENFRKLESCNNHDFSIDLTPDKKFNKKYQCTNCGGSIDWLNKSWYEKGKSHGNANSI